MIRLMCEQMYDGLDNLVNRTLNEKKQEISDEDKRDNELIRSAMRKRQNRVNAKLTKEEKGALERNGWTANERHFSTQNGQVYVGSYGDGNIWHKHKANPVGRRTAIFKDKSVRVKDPEQPNNRWAGHWETVEPNVNLADMGRKQKERNNNITDNIYRGYKKRKNGWGNFEFVERDRNKYPANLSKYKKARENIGYLNRDIEDSKQEIENAYKECDTDRERYLQQISHYKSLLKELDNRLDNNISRINGWMKGYEDSKKEKMDAIRNEFKNRKRESIVRNRRNKLYEELGRKTNQRGINKYGKRFI